MDQRAFSKWLKFIIVGVGLCCAAAYNIVLPLYGVGIVAANPEFTYRFWPWLTFLCGTALPIYAALVFAWKIAANIGRDKSFSRENAVSLKWISWLAAGDTVYFAAGSALMLILGMSHPGIMILSIMVAFVGVAVTVASAALSHLVLKASALQEQSDLTI